MASNLQLKSKVGEAKTSSKPPRPKSIQQTSKVTIGSQQETNSFGNTPSFTPATEKLIKNLHNETYRQSHASQSNSHFQERLRNALQSKIQQAFISLGGTHRDQIEKNLQNLQKITDADEYATEFMRCHAFYVQTSFSMNPELRINLSKIERTRLTLFQEEEDGRKRKNVQSVEKEKEQLKRQLFRCRELAQQQEKRLITLADEFKRRKTFYLKEIDRLSKIISTAVGNIPKLVLAGKKDLFNPQEFQIGYARSARGEYNNNIRSTKDHQDEDLLQTISKDLENNDKNNELKPLVLQKYRSLQELYFPSDPK